MSALWLAIDTATDVASVAVGSAEHIAAVRSIHGARQHAAQIVSLIQQVLAVAKLRLGQITGIIVGDGPGSFTGLRIGWAAAKGIAHDGELPLVAIPSLLGAAHAAHGETAGPVVACFDALRGQVFGAMYEFADPGYPSSIRQPILIVAAGHDELVSTPAIGQFAVRLRAGSHLVIAGSRHEILMEKDHYRQQFWAAFDAFVPGSPLFG